MYQCDRQIKWGFYTFLAFKFYIQYINIFKEKSSWLYRWTMINQQHLFILKFLYEFQCIHIHHDTLIIFIHKHTLTYINAKKIQEYTVYNYPLMLRRSNCIYAFLSNILKFLYSVYILILNLTYIHTLNVCVYIYTGTICILTHPVFCYREVISWDILWCDETIPYRVCFSYYIYYTYCLTLVLLEPKVISLCHMYRARPACISVQSDQVLYCWLTNLSWYSQNW